MKTLVKTFAFLVIVMVGTWLFPQKACAQNSPVSLQVFYDELSPYGTWIEDPTYGYVWIPRVDRDFSPYVTNGHWVFTDYGWTWVSEYPWGWAPFHYGRWLEDPMYGNVWIPDTEWAPAWVTWRQANGYIGWTPMGPGININIAMTRSYNVPRDRWVFVRDHDFMQTNLSRYRMDRSFNFKIFDISILIKNTRFDNSRQNTYFYGPRREDVQRYSDRIINPVHIRDYDRPGQRYDQNYLNIYRPRMEKRNINGYVPAPKYINRNRDAREESGRGRENSSSDRNQYYQDRNSQPNARPYRDQREEQPSSRNTNTYNQERSAQPVNPYRNQNEQPSSRNTNTYNPERSAQPVQQPASNQLGNQRELRAVPNVNTQVNQRPQESQKAATPASRETPAAKSEKAPANLIKGRAIMKENPEKDKIDESKQNENVNQPRR